MKLNVYWIEQPAGRLGVMARPRGGDWLGDEVRALAQDGVGLLVSLLTPAEVEELTLMDAAAACAAVGVEYWSLPIPDRGLPPSPEALDSLTSEVQEQLDRGSSVVVHCRAGIGRVSLLAAVVLIRQGNHPGVALERIALARGLSVPDTDEQRVRVERYAAGRSPARAAGSRRGRGRATLTGGETTPRVV